ARPEVTGRHRLLVRGEGRGGRCRHPGRGASPHRALRLRQPGHLLPRRQTPLHRRAPRRRPAAPPPHPPLPPRPPPPPPPPPLPPRAPPPPPPPPPQHPQFPTFTPHPGPQRLHREQTPHPLAVLPPLPKITNHPDLPPPQRLGPP